jgi:hypothetical protein
MASWFLNVSCNMFISGSNILRIGGLMQLPLKASHNEQVDQTDQLQSYCNDSQTTRTASKTILINSTKLSPNKVHKHDARPVVIHSFRGLILCKTQDARQLSKLWSLEKIAYFRISIVCSLWMLGTQIPFDSVFFQQISSSSLTRDARWSVLIIQCFACPITWYVHSNDEPPSMPRNSFSFVLLCSLPLLYRYPESLCAGSGLFNTDVQADDNINQHCMAKW